MAHHRKLIHCCNCGIDHHYLQGLVIFQISLFSTLPDIFAYHCSLFSCMSATFVKQISSVLRTISSYGDRSFSACIPKVWNSLPINIWETDFTWTIQKNCLKRICFAVLMTHYDFTMILYYSPIVFNVPHVYVFVCYSALEYVFHR